MKSYLTASEQFIEKHSDLLEDLLSVLEKKTNNKPYSLQNEERKKLSIADIIIAEDTYASTDAGYDIALALNLKKQILILRQKGVSAKRSKLLSESDNRKNIKVVEYTKETLKQEIEGFIAEVEKKIDTKFILIISPEIDRYLEWVSKNRRMHKAQAVRRALEQKMIEDSNFGEETTK